MGEEIGSGVLQAGGPPGTMLARKSRTATAQTSVQSYALRPCFFVVSAICRSR